MITNPYMDEGLRRWILQVAYVQAKLIASHDQDDLAQEGYYLFWKCYTRYVGKRRAGHRYLPKRPDATARKHFMALFMRAFSNRIADLKNRNAGKHEVLACDLSITVGDTVLEGYDALERLAPPEQELATVTNLIRTAPKEVIQLFQLLISDVCDGRPYRRYGKRRGHMAQRETNARYWGRLLRLDPAVNVVKKLEEHFLT